MKKHTLLTGIGHYYPGEPVENSYFENIEKLNIDDAWIRKHTGVKSRHWPDTSEERHVEMGLKASQTALEDAGVKPEEIDIIIGTTSTSRPRVNPSSMENNYMDIAPPLQHKLGANNSFVFDLSGIACAGFLYGSVVAQSLLEKMNLKTALVVCTENPKPILNFDFKNSSLFGSAAAAAVWQRRTGETSDGLLDIVLHSDGQYFNAFDIDENNKMLMHGKLVGDTGKKKLVEAGKEVLERNNMTIADIDWFIPHQANINMIDELVAALDVPREKLLLNIDHCGNTSSAGAPSCLSEYVKKGKVKKGDTILTASIGRGFSWGAMIFRYC